MNAGRELDMLVAERVMGWRDLRIVASQEGTHPVGYHPGGVFGVVPRYSTNIAAAWQVVEHLYEQGFDVEIHVLHDWRDKHNAVVWPHRGTYSDGASADAATAPHAICLAALKALRIEP